jgi:hypothetical protein
MDAKCSSACAGQTWLTKQDSFNSTPIITGKSLYLSIFGCLSYTADLIGLYLLYVMLSRPDTNSYIALTKDDDPSGLLL